MKALGMDMGNDIDNDIAARVKQKLTDSVEYDLKNYRCKDCVHYQRSPGRRERGQCMVHSHYSYVDMRYGYTKACKKAFEPKEKTDES